jgi:hypothetical protein
LCLSQRHLSNGLQKDQPEGTKNRRFALVFRPLLAALCAHLFMTPRAIQASRYILGLSWIYHGLFPKLVTVAPLERAMTATLGFSAEISLLITRSAGLAEIVFGTLLIAFYKNRLLLQLSIVALLVLCLFVAIQIPTLLLEAFNPVTTNFALVGLSYVLLENSST